MPPTASQVVVTKEGGVWSGKWSFAARRTGDEVG